jgi:Fe-S oxidoreductase
MATYKAEFLSHYYAGRLRPLSAYSMGLIYWWARLAAHMPRLVNLVAHTPGLADAMKRVGGIAPQREIPLFAPQTFKAWFRQRPPRNQGRPEVLLWPDTFNNHFHPDTAMAAVEVLEAAGYQVRVPDAENPQQALCCGRPLYDYGMLRLARWHLRRILDSLQGEIQRAVPIVVLEPSCCSVFRDELLNMFPNDEDANRLARQTYLLSEFLEKRAHYEPPKLSRKAVVHGHCHHKALLGMKGETALLDRLGLDYKVLDDGCCGMAGSFGFEPGVKYEVSVKCGERVLLPAVREADDETLIISNGFSCREQIGDFTDRKPLHVAQVLRMALHGGELVPANTEDVADALDGRRRRAGRVATALLAGAVAALTGGIVIWRLRGRTTR